MVTAHQEQSKVNDRRPSAIMGRRQELNLQLNQLIDAVILVLCLCGAHAIRLYLGNFYGVAMIEPFKSYLWLIVLIMPFGPLLLDLQGFYSFPLQKTFLKSFTQIAQALLVAGRSNRRLLDFFSAEHQQPLSSDLVRALQLNRSPD